MKSADKNMSVFPQGDLSHAASRRCGAGGPRSVAAAIDRKGWKRVRLGDVCKITKGEQLNRDSLADTGSIPVYNGGSSPSGYADNSNTDAENVIISEGGNSCGYVNFIHVPFWRGGHCYLLETDADKVLLYYVLKAKESKIMSLRVGTGLPNIQRERLNAFEFDLPTDTSEQRQIVSAFTSIDTHITALESLIAKYEAIKKATVNLLLKPKAGWQRVKLGNFEFHRNNTCSRSLTTSTGGEIHNIHYGDILVKFGEMVSLEYDQLGYLTKEGEGHSPKDYLQDGDIVMADTAEDETAGKVVEVQGVADRRVVAGLHTVFLRPPTDLFARGWLGYWMNSKFYHDQLLPYMTGIKVLSLSKSSLANTEIFFPSKAEQGRLVASLESIDTHIVALHAQANKMRHLKEGMMAYFFG